MYNDNTVDFMTGKTGARDYKEKHKFDSKHYF